MLGHCLKKRGRGLDRSIILDPLVDPGNPPHRHEACPAADPARPYPRMVVLAQGPSGQRARCSSQAKIATVMLGLGHQTGSRNREIEQQQSAPSGGLGRAGPSHARQRCQYHRTGASWPDRSAGRCSPRADCCMEGQNLAGGRRDSGLGDQAIGTTHSWETMATLPGWPWDGYFAATNPGLFSPEHVIHSR